MLVVLFILFLAVLFGALGFILHFLWFLALIFAVFWVAGWALSRGEAAGNRRRWYGRW